MFLYGIKVFLKIEQDRMLHVILYQMGKVGSSTLKESLTKYDLKTLHIHRYFFFNQNEKLNFRFFIYKLRKAITFDYFLIKKRIKVITFYRDPLQRNISSFFQNLKFYFSGEELESLTFEKVRDKFNSIEKIHSTPNNWFEVEFKRKLKIDIFDHPFDRDAGYSVFSKKNIDVFICTTEKINTLKLEFGVFLGVENFELIQKNVGDNKWYKELYNEFKKRYTPPLELLDELYNSKTIKHFYTDKKRIELRSKWENK